MLYWHSGSWHCSSVHCCGSGDSAAINKIMHDVDGIDRNASTAVACTHPSCHFDMMASDRSECDKHFDTDSHTPKSLDLAFVVAAAARVLAWLECSPPRAVRTDSSSPCTAAAAADSTLQWTRMLRLWRAWATVPDPRRCSPTKIPRPLCVRLAFLSRSASDSTTTAGIVSRLVKLLPDASIIQFDGKLTSLFNFSAVSSECEEENVEKRKEKEKYPNMRKTAWAGYQNKKEENLH